MTLFYLAREPDKGRFTSRVILVQSNGHRTSVGDLTLSDEEHAELSGLFTKHNQEKGA